MGGGNAGLGWRFLLGCKNFLGRWIVWGCLYCKVKGGWGYRVWGCIYVFNVGVEMSLSKCPRLRRSPRSLNLRLPQNFCTPRPRSLNIASQNFYKSFGCVYVHCTPRFAYTAWTSTKKLIAKQKPPKIDLTPQHYFF